MQCELCGKEDVGCKPAIVDGVRMMLCPKCMKYGNAVKDVTPVSVQKSILRRIKRPVEKDVYVEMNRELVNGWNDLIKKTRIEKGLSREELGFNIGERTVTIAKIENGDLRPPDKIISKLEKALDVTLIEEVEKVTSTSGSSRSNNGLTLGDFIKTEDK